MPPKSRKSGGKKSKSMRGEKRADLIFPVGRLNRLIKHGRYSQRVSGSSGVFMAGVLEWLTAEIIEQAGNIATAHKKKTIGPKHLNLAIRQDEEMNQLMCEVVIASGGQLPNVNEFFLAKKK